MTSSLEPVGNTSLVERATDQLRTAIREGHYPPGARLVERKLAHELGISHIPVREALARLTDEGLVERLPRRGARVAGLGAKDLEEVSTLRTILEEFVVLRVQERLTQKDERELRRLVKQMEDAANRGDYRRVFELDQEFHARLWALSDHALLIEMATQLRARIDAFLKAATLALSPEDLVAHARTHRELLDAITSRQARAGRKAVAGHIKTATERLRHLITVEPDGAE